jgi:hypothetical protein
MALTAPQLVALKTYIDATPSLAAFPNSYDGAFEVAAALNALASPAYSVWRTDVTLEEVMRNGFDWARVDNLTPGKARIWDWMTRQGTIDASKPNVRAGIDATWVGTAADLAVRAAVYTHCNRSATVAEKLFATGAGTTASPSTMAFEGLVTYMDVYQARNPQG